MKCGRCLQDFKSHLRLQAHLAREHGVQNEFAYMSIREWQKEWKRSKLEPFDNARDNTQEKRDYF